VAQNYRSDLVDAAALLRRVVDESGEQLAGELRRAINNLLEDVTRTIEAAKEGQTP